MACEVCHKPYTPDVSEESDAKPHVCSTCGQSFSLKIQLKRHAALHSGSGYVCVKCARRPDDETTTERRPHKRRRKSVIGSQDGDEDKTSAGERQKGGDDDSNHNQDDGVAFTDAKRARRSLKKYTCSSCSRVFSYHACLDKHIKMGKCFSDEANSRAKGIDEPTPKAGEAVESGASENTPSKDDPGGEGVRRSEQKHSCNMCGKSFARKSALEGHELSHFSDDISDGNDDNIASNDREEEVKKQMLKLNLKKPFMCKDCNFLCFSEKTLRKHALNHITDAPVKSSIEDKQPRNDETKQKEPTREKPTFQCEKCDRIFKHGSRFKKHLKTHSLEKHKKAKIFGCATCGKKFAGMACLAKHEDRHKYGISVPKTKYIKSKEARVCSFCKEKFLCTKSFFNKHMNTHMPEVCGICDERFVDRPALREHCKVHVGTEAGRMFMECSQKALDAKNGNAPPEPKVEYIYLVLH